MQKNVLVFTTVLIACLIGLYKFMTPLSPEQQPLSPCLNEAQMVFVPAGSFVMGAGARYSEETPARKVDVAGFWISQTEGYL